MSDSAWVLVDAVFIGVNLAMIPAQIIRRNWGWAWAGVLAIIILAEGAADHLKAMGVQ